jgi:chromosome segregation ATPase
MPDRARLTSTEALLAFQARLVAYQEKARATVEEVTGDVLRLRLWLQDTQRGHWEGELRRRSRQLDEAKQALYNAELASLRAPTNAEQLAVRKARTAVEEAEGRLAGVRRWNREFDSRVEPEVRHLNGLHTFLSKDLREAVAHLNALAATLEDYAGVKPPGEAGTPPATPSAPTEEGA